MIKRLRMLFLQRHIFRNIVLKELKARYAGSLLGISWVVITPLLITAAINFVFTKVMQINIEYFPLFILSAFFPWMSFSASLFEATNSIIKNENLLKQFAIPREIIPIASVTANFIKFFCGFIAVFPIFIIFNLKIIPFLLFLPLVFLLHFVFTVGVSLLLSCANVFIRDISYSLEVIMMFWLWMTPVFYSIDMVPIRFHWVCALNPMTPYITMYRNILFEAKMPSLYLVGISFGTALITLIIGYATFIKYDAYFLKKI